MTPLCFGIFVKHSSFGHIFHGVEHDGQAMDMYQSNDPYCYRLGMRKLLGVKLEWKADNRVDQKKTWHAQRMGVGTGAKYFEG